MLKNQCVFLSVLCILMTGQLCAETVESTGVAQVERFNWLILLAAIFALGVVITVALCRRFRRRQNKLHGLSHML